MGQSLIKNYMHLVFSTKHRQPLIYPWIENNLYSYMAGICKELDCQPIKIGGHIDHVHILCMLSKHIALIKLLEDVKKVSSKWMKTKSPELTDFYWQNGYGAFSVSPYHVHTVSLYIERQKEHHKKKSFQKEFLAILKKCNVDYDEQYVWD